MSSNLLAGETSPYLLQHRDNPVHWHPWSSGALERAGREDRPILLSIGYSACHWCHVMAHESFEDPVIADLINRHFVAVKVDREEQPYLDHVYQTALALLGQSGGWPLTMFLTSDGHPFWGGTYFPPVARFGRPAFADVLRGVIDVYARRRSAVFHDASELTAALVSLTRRVPGASLTLAKVDSAAQALADLVDVENGGTYGAPKFPQVPLFRFLWRMFLRTRETVYRDAVVITLVRLCNGGIYDHLGGGFARYTVDEKWLAPHFEKMLTDNVLLLELLADVWSATGVELFAERAAQVVSWLLRDMRISPDGLCSGAFAFAGALDADSEGEEGRYYVWTEREIDNVLGAVAPAFKTAYGVSSYGNWEGRNILHRSPSSMNDDAGLAEARARLLAARRLRPFPHRDDKVLTDANAMAVAALAHAGALFSRPDWVEAACAVYAFLRSHLVTPEGLRHSWCKGRVGHAAVLDDHACLARAALVLYRVTGDSNYLAEASAYVEEAIRLYWDNDGGGCFLAARDASDITIPAKPAVDTAVPSGNGVLAEVLAQMFHLTGKSVYGERARRLIAALAYCEERHLLSIPTLLSAFIMLECGMVGSGAAVVCDGPSCPAPVITVDPASFLFPSSGLPLRNQSNRYAADQKNIRQTSDHR